MARQQRARLKQLGPTIIILSQAAEEALEEEKDAQDEEIRATLVLAQQQSTLAWADIEDTPEDEPPTIAEVRKPRAEAARGVNDVPALGNDSDLEASLKQALEVLKDQRAKDMVVRDMAFRLVQEIAQKVLDGQAPIVRFFGSSEYLLSTGDSDFDIMVDLPARKGHVLDFLANCAVHLARRSVVAADLGGSAVAADPMRIENIDCGALTYKQTLNFTLNGIPVDLTAQLVGNGGKGEATVMSQTLMLKRAVELLPRAHQEGPL